MKIKEILSNTDKPASSRKSDICVPAHPPFGCDTIIHDLVLALNYLWSRYCFTPGYTWVDIDNHKIPYCSETWRLYGW